MCLMISKVPPICSEVLSGQAKPNNKGRQRGTARSLRRLDGTAEYLVVVGR
jgi:hypothetical protein